jgi:hypothetical protein
MMPCTLTNFNKVIEYNIIAKEISDPSGPQKAFKMQILEAFLL